MYLYVSLADALIVLDQGFRLLVKSVSCYIYRSRSTTFVGFVRNTCRSLVIYLYVSFDTSVSLFV